MTFQEWTPLEFFQRRNSKRKDEALSKDAQAYLQELLDPGAEASHVPPLLVLYIVLIAHNPYD